MLNVAETEWSKIQEVLWGEPDSKIDFWMTLCLRDDGEVLWENTEPPGLTQKVLTTEGNDVIPIPPAGSAGSAGDAASATADDAQRPTKPTPPEAPDHLDSLVDLINRNGGHQQEFFDPEKYFKGRRDAMLEFYTIDGVPYDVATPAGRLAFQRKASEKLLFQHDRKRKIKKNVKKFRNLKLNKAQKVALLKVKIDK